MGGCGRCEVDRRLHTRKLKPAVEDRRPNPLPALPDRHVGQPDNDHRRGLLHRIPHSRREVDLHLDQRGIDPKDSGTQGFEQHGNPSHTRTMTILTLCRSSGQASPDEIDRGDGRSAESSRANAIVAHRVTGSPDGPVKNPLREEAESGMEQEPLSARTRGQQRKGGRNFADPVSSG